LLVDGLSILSGVDEDRLASLAGTLNSVIFMVFVYFFLRGCGRLGLLLRDPLPVYKLKWDACEKLALFVTRVGDMHFFHNARASCFRIALDGDQNSLSLGAERTHPACAVGADGILSSGYLACGIPAGHLINTVPYRYCLTNLRGQTLSIPRALPKSAFFRFPSDNPTVGAELHTFSEASGVPRLESEKWRGTGAPEPSHRIPPLTTI
jgi:hypothetical protein